MPEMREMVSQQGNLERCGAEAGRPRSTGPESGKAASEASGSGERQTALEEVSVVDRPACERKIRRAVNRGPGDQPAPQTPPPVPSAGPRTSRVGGSPALTALSVPPPPHRPSVKSDSLTTCTVAHQTPRSLGFPRQEHWSGLPVASPGDLPDPGMEPESPPARVGGFFTTEAPGEPCLALSLLFSHSVAPDSL